MVASRAVSFKAEERYEPLTFAEVFHLATMGGATVLGMDSIIGNFVLGKRFDALLVTTLANLFDLAALHLVQTLH